MLAEAESAVTLNPAALVKGTPAFWWTGSAGGGSCGAEAIRATIPSHQNVLTAANIRLIIPAGISGFGVTFAILFAALGTHSDF